MSWIRLRQIALVAADLDAVVGGLQEAFRLKVAFNDPAVAAFGLRNAVLPIGHQFIEVVSPTRDGTAGGRQLARLGGDGGYMVICHTDDQGAVRGRLRGAGVRVAFEAEDHGYRIMQLHPGDTGGSFLEVDFQPGGEDPEGPWTPAGPDWRSAVCTETVQGISGVTVQTADVARTLSRWSAVLGIEAVDGAIALDDAEVRFVAGPVDSLVEVTVTGPERGRSWDIGGVRFRS